MTSILDLPEEIRPFIAKFLDNKALQACLLVCRSFHQSFEPFLWHKVVIRVPTSKYVIDRKLTLVDLAALQSRTLDVHNYVLHGAVSSEHYRLAFPHLRRLQLTDDGKSGGGYPSSEYYESPPNPRTVQQGLDQTQLVQLNPTVQTLVLTILDATPSTEFWNLIYSTWVHPRILHVQGHASLSEEATVAFWKACSRFEEVTFIALAAVPSPVLATLTFPRIRNLSIITVGVQPTHWLDANDQLIFMKACPNLKHLTWEAHTEHSLPLSDFQQALDHNHWPNLNSLDFRRLYRNLGEELATLLQSLPAMTALRFKLCQITDGGFQALRDRQFEAIRTIKIFDGCRFTSKMAQEVLTQCVHLEVFRSTHIYTEDVGPHAPWVCRNLRRLTICILQREADQTGLEQQQVYAQLARMTELVHLDLGQYPMGFIVSDREFHQMNALNTLDIRLKAGLGQLSSLTKLQFFGFENTFQITSMTEIDWMLDHWKALRTVHGRLDGLAGSEVKTAAYLNKRGIQYHVRA
ncbi:hypothetical protein BGX33_009253 [Mortierella sp. NVP41]|nr:hypothetical protein BGX33_009253 [Mortierella sp. NVP41]